MRNDRSTITIPTQSYGVILDAIQLAIADRYAAKATRKAAFSVLLALIEAGAVVGDPSIYSPARDTGGARRKYKDAAAFLGLTSTTRDLPTNTR
jgi:hypothetical protein